jgi:hypothetical protein
MPQFDEPKSLPPEGEGAPRSITQHPPDACGRPRSTPSAHGMGRVQPRTASAANKHRRDRRARLEERVRRGYHPRHGGRYDSGEDWSPSPEPPGLRVFSRAIRRAPFLARFRAPTTITKYSGETRPELWLADYRLACQLGGTDDDNLIIRNLPLFLSDAARTWLEHLPPAQIFDWDDLVKAFAGNFHGTYVHPGNSWDLQSCRQQPGESLREYIRWFSKQCTKLPNIIDSDVIGAFLAGTTCRDLVSKLGRKTPTKVSELMDIATKFASGQEAVEAIFQKDKQPQGRQKEDAPEASVQRGTKKRPRRRREQNATPLTRISSLLPSTGTLGNFSEGPTCSTRCSRSCAPITGVPSSTPLRSATCSGVTSTRLDPRQKVAKTKATTRRGRQGRGVPGGPQLLHDLRQTGGERLGSAPQAGVPGGLLGEGNGAGLPRLIRQAHHLRPRRPPRLRTEPRKVPACCRPCHR